MNAIAALDIRAQALERLRAIHPRMTIIADDEGLKPFETDAFIAHRETPMLAVLPDNEAQVREEYAWVPGWVFRRKRSEILAKFLSREHLFNTGVFRNDLEAQARLNLQRSISVLRPWWRRF